MKKIAVFASGTGTNFEAIAQACADGRIPAKVVLLVCDNPNAQAIQRAQKFKIDTFSVSPKSYPTKSDYEHDIVIQLINYQVDWICLAGYMRIVADTLLNAFRGRIVNIHPSLLPAFKGAHAVEDAVQYGVKIYGITIHYVDETLDGGKIIAQKAFEYEGNDPAEVHRIGQKIEHELYVDTIKKLILED